MKLFYNSLKFQFVFACVVSFLLLNSELAISQGSGKALDFGGTDEYVDFGSATELRIEGDLTLECWVNIATGPGDNNLYALITYGTNGESESTNQLYRLQIADVDGSAAVTYRHQIVHETGAGVDVVTLFDSIEPIFGSWTHLAVTRDTVTSEYVLYINGVLTQTETYTDNLDPSGGGSGIGVLSGGFGSTSGSDVPVAGFLSGEMDEVRIWNTVRTATQIQDNMCKKLSGSESGLQGYWRLDSSSGSTATDETGNNSGTLTNMEDGDWVTSGAAIGDASIADYTSPSSVNLAHPDDGDDVTVDNLGGSPDGVQIYRVDEAPNVTTPPSGYFKIDDLRYWGVFIAGGTTPTYDITYNYDGHPGIGNEDDLRLASRSDNAASSWSDLGITPNTSNNTLKKTGESGTEYILGTTSSDNPLPVQLASFNASVVSEGVKLEWVTYSEIDNQGYELWRSQENKENYRLIANYQDDPALEGAGNSNTTHQYSYIDKTTGSDQVYFYQLVDVSFNGEKTQHKPISIFVSKSGNAAENFVLDQNYPNPFNPYTYINFRILQTDYNMAQSVPVRLTIYDLLGGKIRTLIQDDMQIGDHRVVWDGTDDAGNRVASGTYIYNLNVGNQTSSKKLILVR